MNHESARRRGPCASHCLRPATVHEVCSVGVLGGTFDPVHNGHLAIAKAARDALALDLVLFVPARIQPHKLDRPVSPVEHRWAMLLLALEGQEGLSASRIELDREGPSYTADTMLELRASYGDGVRLYFICGADALAEMDSWYRPDRLLANAAVAVARRPGCAASSRITQLAAHLTQAFGGEVIAFDAPLLDISSTMIRERVGSGACTADVLPHAVCQYMLTHHLYGEGKPT
jgi:nicotinate-nucleotide adenylyltransferase